MQPTPYGSTRSTSYADRLRGALMLDAQTYRDVEQDTNANGQAALTVVLTALASGIGAILSRDIIQNVLGVVISSVLQWVVFSFVAYFVGASLFSTGQTSVTPGQVLRTIGFAQAPKLFLVLGIIPILGWIAGLVVFFWFLAAAILALREAFEFDTGRAIGTGLVALIGILIVDIVLSLVFGIGSALFGGLSSVARTAF
ncbi:MAG TPA: YIP1 family protein [Thermomicrobiales bacterium]|nr:YIP1 family protein [Thermomicrobiales bacterium]